MGARVHGHQQRREQQRGDGESRQETRVRGLKRARCSVSGVHELGFAGGGDNGITGARHVADGVAKTGEIHRAPHDVLHLAAGLAEQVPSACEQLPGRFIGDRSDTELRVPVQQRIVDVAEEHGIAAEAIGGGEPARAAANEPFPVDQHALDQHQLARRDTKLLGGLLGGGHGSHQVVAGHQHARGDTLKAHQRLLEVVAGGLARGQRLELVAEPRPLHVQLGKTHFDVRRRRPQPQGWTRRIEILEQLAGVSMPLPEQLQRDVGVAGGARRHTRHLQREQHLLPETREELRIVPGAAFLVEVGADGEREQKGR